MSTSITLQEDVKNARIPGTAYISGNGIRQRANNVECDEETPHYFIRPFKEGAASLSSLQSFLQELVWLFNQREAQQTLGLVAVNLLATLLLLSWCHATRSMALMAYTYLSWFSLLSLVTCLVCVWAESQKATPTFTFGYRRCEALAVFASVTLSLLGAVIIVKECIERLLEPEEVHTGMLCMGGIVGLLLHLGMTALAHNPPLTQVLRASQSSLLQEHVADMCQSLCNYVPTLSRVLLPRVNPVVLISIAGFLAIIGDHIILQIYNYQAADSIAALIIAILTITTMFPLCVCSASILLQTTPVSVFAQLDKCLREALTLDGVLEFRHENIWTLGLSDPSRDSLSALGDHSGFILTGSLHVRIRRDANEQMVLAHVRERLAPLVPLLTVQVFKDDWTRSSTTLQLLNDSSRALASSPSHSPHYVNVTYPHIYPSAKSAGGRSPFFPHTSPVGPPSTYSSSSLSQGSIGFSHSTPTLSSSASAEHYDHGAHRNLRNERMPFQNHLSNDTHRLSSAVHKEATYLSSPGLDESQGKAQGDRVGEGSFTGNQLSQKPSPYYVNVDFLNRSNVLHDNSWNASGSRNQEVNLVRDGKR
ncbi:zinc transporter 6-like isoform X1 [Penaeus japonicus]|uniref:zinc transporter 6-like isoform X1 n=2 Tax=Penaeus japonicus TaxID=27405 RepID=UPI001C7179D6|nr:zinc transporter 6-like isoform X1 [Penaeus japonicus]